MSDKQLLDTYILTIKNKKATSLEWENFCQYVKNLPYFKELIKSGILD